MIKVIGGKYRSRILQTPDQGTEPTKNRVREAIASAIGDLLPGAIVLDLFAGSGAFGIECLSRGAGEAHFVDLSPVAISIIKDNLRSLHEDHGYCHQMDYRSYLQQGHQPLYDLVFLDPPYADKEAYANAVSMLLSANLLSQNAAIVLEYEGGISVDLSLFAKIKEYTYGKTKVLIARRSL